jgi:hypothetical protein
MVQCEQDRIVMEEKPVVLCCTLLFGVAMMGTGRCSEAVFSLSQESTVPLSSMLESGARLEVEVGVVRSGRDAVFRLAIPNDQESVLQILETETSCGCMIANLESSRILPGEKASVEVKLSAFYGEQDLKKKVRIRFSLEGQGPRDVDLVLSGEVRQAISFGTEQVIARRSHAFVDEEWLVWRFPLSALDGIDFSNVRIVNDKPDLVAIRLIPGETALDRQAWVRISKSAAKHDMRCGFSFVAGETGDILCKANLLYLDMTEVRVIPKTVIGHLDSSGKATVSFKLVLPKKGANLTGFHAMSDAVDIEGAAFQPRGARLLDVSLSLDAAAGKKVIDILNSATSPPSVVVSVPVELFSPAALNVGEIK